MRNLLNTFVKFLTPERLPEPIKPQAFHRLDKVNKPKKSKFQERLEIAIEQSKGGPKTPSRLKESINEMADNWDINKNIFPGDKARNILKLHEYLQQNKWIDITKEKPVYYAPVDIHTGKKIYENWSRVSDGERDYYVNGNDDHVILKVKYWRKREGIIYPKYDPMTEDDLKPKLSYYDMTELLEKLKDEYLDDDHTQYNLGVSHTINTIEDFINEKLGNTK